MNRLETKQIFWFLFYLTSGTIFALNHCGEFHNDSLVQRRIFGIKLSFQTQLGKLIDGFNSNNPFKVKKAIKSLENVKLNESSELSDDFKKTIPKRIESEGYPSETHSVMTSDGYILQLFRIPSSPKSPNNDQPKVPVYLMHAFMESANGFVVLGPEHSIAYLLADAGFDVWLGNARGTEPSQAHISLNPRGGKQKEFWSYSWHEIGLYDISASIDYILNITDHQKLHYIGYSQGTTSFLVLMSMRPEYNQKIIEANLLAPAAYMKNVRNPFFKTLSHFYRPLKLAFNALGIYKISLNNDLLLRIAEFACRKVKESTPLNCQLILSVIYSDQINCTSLRNILEFTPAGASTKQALHYIQLIRSGDFRQFDYEDKKLNHIMYGSQIPPSYNLTQITVPVNLFYSKDDTTAIFQNVVELQSKLPNVKQSYIVPIPKFEHVDFIYSRFVREALNEKIINIIQMANGMV